MRLRSPIRQAGRGDVLSLRLLPPSTRQEVHLRYVGSKDAVYVLAPGDPSPRWASVLAHDTHMVSWQVEGRDYIGNAHVIDDPLEREELVRRFEAAHGVELVRRWFGSHVQGFVLNPFPTDRDGYEGLVERYFEGLAAVYDRLVRENPFDLQLRIQSGEILSRAFRAGQRVLEIGAGTGLETLPLARRGVHVVATDISQSMLDNLEKKAKAEGLADLVVTRRVRASNLHVLLEEFGFSSFDGAFSNFGALNCEPELERIPGVLAQFLPGGSRVVLTVWNRVCLSEMILSLVTLRPGRAFSRLLEPVPVGRSRFGVPVFAWSAGEFGRAFSPYFQVERTMGMPVFVPPYDFARRLEGHELVTSVLESLDRRYSGRSPLNRLGDHFVMELTRTDNGGGFGG